MQVTYTVGQVAGNSHCMCNEKSEMRSPIFDIMGVRQIMPVGNFTMILKDSNYTACTILIIRSLSHLRYVSWEGYT